MSIKVPGHVASTVNLAAYARTQSNKAENEQHSAGAPAEQPVPASSDRVSLTNEGQAMQNVDGSQMVVDLHRVESLRKDIARGAYNTDSGRVADKFFSFERALSA